jgi:hypothetical protein
LASSGGWAKLASSGKNSVIAAIGVNSSVMGVIGCWITLAEHDNLGVVKCVKSAMIDGKVIKENVYYELKNGEFVESYEGVK